MEIREYVDDYVEFFPEEWTWTLKGHGEQNQRYLETRARKSPAHSYKNLDKLPFFDSLEKDANQFGLSHYEFTDVFGLVWEGKKGVHRSVGAPDYDGHLYYYTPEDEWNEEGWQVSEDYDDCNNQPPKDVYVRLSDAHSNRWVDFRNIVECDYHYMVDNHLFKDTYFTLNYGEGDELRVYGDYQTFLFAVKKSNARMFNKLLAQIDEHFLKLRDSEREDEREVYEQQVNGKTAREYFGI